MSILSNFSKLLEFIIHDHILHNVKLNPDQHGFTNSKSTVTNLVMFLDFMTLVVRGQRQAYAVCFDLSNAFDLVPHSMFLHKLSFFGFSDACVSWFHSYLTNRQSRVYVSGTLFLPFQVTSSVPQGFVLGSFLFNVFINDLCNSVNHCKFLIFAADFKIFYVVNSPHDCHLLQSDFNFLVTGALLITQGLILLKCMLYDTAGR
jgi:hypothetical protein